MLLYNKLGIFVFGPVTWTKHLQMEQNFCQAVTVVSQAPTVEVKMAWLNELRRILTNQQKLLRGQRTSGVNMGH